MVTFYYLSNHIEEYAYAFGIGLAGFTFFLYLSDCYYWDSPCGVAAKRIFIIGILIGLGLLLLTLSGRHPYGPISLYVVLTPMWMFAIKLIFYKKIRTKKYICWLSGPFLFVSTIVFIAWAAWALSDNSHEWNAITELVDAIESGCKPNFEDREFCRLERENDVDACFSVNITEASLTFPDGCPQICTDIYDDCLNTFILWVGPFLVSLGLCFLSFFSSFLRASGSIETEALNFAKIWLFLLFAMWVSASLAGAGAGVSTTLAALTLSSFVGSSVFLAYSFSRIEHEERLEQLWHNFIEKYGVYMDLARGLLVATCTPVFACYLFASFLTQQLRNISTFCRLHYGKPEDDSMSLRSIGGRGWVTVEARRVVKEINSWDRVSVYTYAIYWGIGFMSLIVFANKFTTLFLSWLIEQTASMTLTKVTGILIGVGTVMFLLPPVPGLPIYLTLGIVIIPVGKEDFGLVWSNVYAVAVSLALKLMATILQQKMIGELLKSSVYVRRLVGINSTLIRAMKLVLQSPGMSFAKVAMLCGGPDWPTSVLCGIMGLKLLPILVGTLPIIALVLPTVLSGSFTYMAKLTDDNQNLLYPWAETAKAISAAMAALVLFANMFFAAVYVEDTIRTRKDELDAIPIDEEVKKAEDEAERVNKAYKEVTEWKLVPWCAKATLILSMLCIIASCWMVQMFQDRCFEDYELTHSITEHLDGDWKNFLKPVGTLAILLFIFSIILLQFFSIWATRQAQEKLSATKDEESELVVEPKSFLETKSKSEPVLKTKPEPVITISRSEGGFEASNPKRSLSLADSQPKSEPVVETTSEPVITTSQSEGGVEIRSSLVTFSEELSEFIPQNCCK